MVMDGGGGGGGTLFKYHLGDGVRFQSEETL